MKTTSTFKTCPTCGSRKIQKLATDFRGRIGTRIVSLPKLERHECPACGEILFGYDSMKRIEESRPRKSHRKIASV